MGKKLIKFFNLKLFLTMQTISLRTYPEMIPLYERHIPNLRKTINQTNNDVVVEVNEYDYYISHQVVPFEGRVKRVELPIEIEANQPKASEPKRILVSRRKIQKPKSSEKPKNTLQPKSVEANKLVKVKTEALQARGLDKKQEITEQAQSIEAAERLSPSEIMANEFGLTLENFIKVKQLSQNNLIPHFIAKRCGCTLHTVIEIQNRLK